MSEQNKQIDVQEPEQPPFAKEPEVELNFEELADKVIKHAARSASDIEQEFFEIADMIEMVKVEQNEDPTEDRQAALARISAKIRELKDVVDTALIRGK